MGYLILSFFQIKTLIPEISAFNLGIKFFSFNNISIDLKYLGHGDKVTLIGI